MLAGYRVLVVEDEALVASAISELLSDAEGVPVGPAASVCEARRLIKYASTLDAVLLDVNLSDGSVTPVLEFFFNDTATTEIYTGGVVPEGVRQRHPDLLALSKPVLPARLVGELRKLIGSSWPRQPQG